MNPRPLSFFLCAALLAVVTTFTPSCAALDDGAISWKSLYYYNASSKPICVISVEGIQAFQKGLEILFNGLRQLYLLIGR